MKPPNAEDVDQYEFAFKPGRIEEALLVTPRDAGLPEPLLKNF
jgi:hypothetical protein